MLSKEYKDKVKKIEELWENLHELDSLAKEYGINDIFQDNGGKVLQQLIYLDMEISPGREGSDAIDSNGMEYEMKSINIETSSSGFSTNHHVTQDVIDRYRKLPWTFSIYEGINLKEIYILQPKDLEPIYKKWEEKLETQSHLNNPKIPIKYVKKYGKLIKSIETP